MYAYVHIYVDVITVPVCIRPVRAYACACVPKCESGVECDHNIMFIFHK